MDLLDLISEEVPLIPFELNQLEILANPDTFYNALEVGMVAYPQQLLRMASKQLGVALFLQPSTSARENWKNGSYELNCPTIYCLSSNK